MSLNGGRLTLYTENITTANNQEKAIFLVIYPCSFSNKDEKYNWQSIDLYTRPVRTSSSFNNSKY